MGRRFSKMYLNRIIEAVDIDWLLADYYGLEGVEEKRDGWLNANCPFHDDNSPSFDMRSEDGDYDKGFWKCWVCGSGNLFGFVMRKSSVEFPAAVKLLARKFKVPDSQNLEQLSRLKEMADPDIRIITKSDEKRYEPIFLTREFPELSLYYLIVERRYTSSEAREIVDRYDFGFCIYRDSYGKPHECIGFDLFDEGKLASTFLQGLFKPFKRYAKGSKIGQLLFDLDGVKGNRVILCEGLWDVLRVRSFGFPATTSFRNGITQVQARRLARFDEVYVAFDSDTAGVSGADEVQELLSGVIIAKSVVLPSHRNDPDDCCKEEFQRSMAEAGW